MGDPEEVQTETRNGFSATCMAFLREMAARIRCRCTKGTEPCMGSRDEQGLCKICANGCTTLILVRETEDETIHHAPARRTEIKMTDRTNAVRAARKATIDRAVAYLSSADRDAVVALLAPTPIADRLKTDPDALKQALREADPQNPNFFAKWKAAQNVLRAAGLPWD